MLSGSSLTTQPSRLLQLAGHRVWPCNPQATLARGGICQAVKDWQHVAKDSLQYLRWVRSPNVTDAVLLQGQEQQLQLLVPAHIGISNLWHRNLLFAECRSRCCRAV